HADIFVYGWTRATAGNRADRMLVIINDVADAAHAAIQQFDPDQFAFKSLLFYLEQCITPDEIPFIEFYRPAQVGLQRIGLVTEFVTVEAIAGLQAQGVACS